ncbi:MAG: hypothetical protein KBG14_11670 [Bacteroidales bacterium]|jgi:hypothetical protein|nr:hypothetical protein [Bacteroidales bacterium]
MKRILYVLITLLVTILGEVKSQESQSIKTQLKFDFVSRHLWRGMRNNTSPAVQPTIRFEGNKIYGGFWASYSLDSENVQEIDIYTGTKYKNLSFAIFDYYNPIDTIGWQGDFFEFRNSKTRHTLDAILTLNQTENFPFNITLSTMFYGFDKDSTTRHNLYSTYIELEYMVFKRDETSISIHLGATPYKSYYANRAALVNSGITVIRNIHINSYLTIPVKGSFILNPYTHQVFLLAAFTIQ